MAGVALEPLLVIAAWSRPSSAHVSVSGFQFPPTLEYAQRPARRSPNDSILRKNDAPPAWASRVAGFRDPWARWITGSVE
jgi:hypothetical protein